MDFLKLFKDKESLEILEIIFPQLKNIKILKTKFLCCREFFKN